MRFLRQSGWVWGGVAVWWLASGSVDTRAEESVERRPPGFAYTAEQTRDPMQSLLPQPEPPPSIGSVVSTPQPPAPPQPPAVTHLEGIVWSAGKRQAIIDGEVYVVGDAVGGGVIADIGRAGVIIRMPGGRFLVSEPSAALPPDGAYDAPRGMPSMSESTVQITPLDDDPPFQTEPNLKMMGQSSQLGGADVLAAPGEGAQ